MRQIEIGFFIVTVLSSAASAQLCQISLDCSEPLPERMVQCFAPFNNRFMAPLTRLQNPVNEGRHLLDVYENSTDDQDCSSLGVYVQVTQSTTLSVNLVINCQSTATLPMFLLNYISNNQSAKSPCGQNRSGSLAVDIVGRRFYRSEQLRLTEISSDTVLVEDLSSQVPPGTRMFFRVRPQNSSRNTHKCYCKNYNELAQRYYATIRSSSWRKVRKRNTSEREFRIALVLVLLQLLSMVLGKVWMMRRMPRRCSILKRA